MNRWTTTILCAGLLLLWGCDAVQPVAEADLVVEAYVTAGPQAPPVFVRVVHPLTDRRETVLEGIDDAEILFTVNGHQIRYVPSGKGRYDPDGASVLPRPIEPGDAFSLRVSRGEQRVEGGGRVPPSIRLTDIRVSPAERAVPAVLVDSLDIGLDSLDLGLDAARGFIYPVEVDVAWDGREDGLWVETQLRPENRFSSSVLDFFLLPNAVQPEDRMPAPAWRGVYAVPVQAQDDPMPVHALLVGIARGDASFAAFATGRIDTATRTPTSNVTGGLGFIGGVALDTLRLTVEPR